jgi:hypothetical protein
MRLPLRAKVNVAPPSPKPPTPTSITIDNNMYPGYSLVTVSCADRNALLFDTVRPYSINP